MKFTPTVWLTTGILTAISCLIISCEKPKEPVKVYQSYLFSSHDSASGEWVIIRTDNENHIKTKIIAECLSYKWGNNEPVKGIDSCSMIVGRKIVPNLFPSNPADFVYVSYQTDFLSISEGEGEDRVIQSFNIKSASVIP